MNIEFYGKNMALTPAIKAYIQKKLDRLEKFHEKIVEVRAEVESDEHHHRGLVFRCEVNLTIPHQMLRAETVAEDLYSAIDMVKDDLELQLRKMKGKRQGRRRKAQISRREAKEF